MTILRFRDNARVGAILLIEGTSLGFNDNGPLMVTDYGESLEVIVDDRWRWSSGELILLDLLRTFAQIDLSGLDEQTQRVAFRALVASVGRTDMLAEVGA